MAVNFPSQEEHFATIAWEAAPWESEIEPSGAVPPIRIDALAVALLILALFLGIQIVTDNRRGTPISKITETSTQETASPDSARRNSQEESTTPENVVPLPPSFDPAVIIYPYDEYWLTQGPHGMSYGHMAIDLAAGKGTVIKSPIHGRVEASYVDVYGNTTLILENERYQVTLLHGDYTVVPGQEVTLGEPVGTESNNGYTTDMAGRPCQGRDCGHHTHLNVYDKSLGQNVNPLDVLSP